MKKTMTILAFLAATALAGGCAYHSKHTHDHDGYGPHSHHKAKHGHQYENKVPMVEEDHTGEKG